jgi:putative spermidine/putrescine transport system substrate-binding protein
MVPQMPKRVRRARFSAVYLILIATSCSPRKSETPGIELVVVSYPGEAQTPYRKFLADPFEKAHPGITVRLVPSESEDVVAQIKAARGASPYDVITLGEPRQIMAVREGWVEQTPRDQLPNLREVNPQFLKACRDYGIAETYSLIGLAYNPEKVPKPESWADLWKPEYKGKIGLTTPASNLGFAVVIMIAKIFGGDEDHPDPAWGKLKELEPFVVAPNPSSLSELFERNEIAVAPMWNNDAAYLARQGLGIKFIMPKPGAILVVSCMDVVKGSAQVQLGRQFLNEEISVNFQLHYVQPPWYFGPTNQQVPIPSSSSDYLPATSTELARCTQLDWDKATHHRAEVTERFDREFGR